MRLLIVTQAVDRDDPVLGFFHRWVEEFSKQYEHVHVICLKRGRHSLPKNVTVLSLGKEERESRIRYIGRFFTYAWRMRRDYDAVLVHMNQEYVLLAGLLWRMMGKRVYLWRNHWAGSLMTNLAVTLSHKVFCTSRFSYTAKFRKTVLMPVGVDTSVFRPLSMDRKRNSILSLGRVAPSKRIDVLIGALASLMQKGTNIEADIYGDPLPKSVGYRDSLMRRAEEMGLSNVRFRAGVPNDETPEVYSAHDIFVNCSGSGMYDKTIFEAAACGCLVLASSRDFSEIAPEFSFAEGNADELSAKLQHLTTLSDAQRDAARGTMQALAKRHSLQELGRRLKEEIV